MPINFYGQAARLLSSTIALIGSILCVVSFMEYPIFIIWGVLISVAWYLLYLFAEYILIRLHYPYATWKKKFWEFISCTLWKDCECQMKDNTF